MQDAQRLPGWFRALFVAVMLVVCVLLAYFAVERVALQAQIDDLTVSLETSRGREARQTHEYEEAAAALPLAQAELARVAPLAEAAKAREAELRQQRKEMRADNAALNGQLAEAQAALDEVMAQLELLLESVDGLRDVLSVP